ncbi:MAG: nuclear transport factor 2 family protein [Acidobacteriota bacterium]|nr:nuclear transport factor 2 family protein [Acidobacteriota bacterium]
MIISLIFAFCFHAALPPQQFNQQRASQGQPAQHSSLTGVYRIDIPASDKLYSVVAGGSSNVPFGEQQRFFIDLAVRLTPPDLLAIEQRGAHISLGSSRAPRMTFVADGVTRSTRAQDGHVVRLRFSVENGNGNSRLVFTSSGRTEDNFTIVFESINEGKQLRVVRRIEAEALDQPLVIRTIYNKVSEVARWELYAEAQAVTSAATPATSSQPASDTAPPVDPVSAGALRAALNEWIDATTKHDIEKQMSFYMPRLKRFYLTSDTSRAFVREEKARVFANAALIDIRAEEPEIIFQDGGRTAIMRYRKKYRIENGRQSRRGEVIQELRWQRVGQEWRIFSERDIRVLR